MAFKDALLPMSSYPEPTPTAAIEKAVDIAGAFGMHISALTLKIEVLNNVASPLASKLLDVPGMVAAERQKNEANAQALASVFERLATQRGIPYEQITESCSTAHLASIVADRARMHDLTMLPIGEMADFQQYVAEAVIFGSGRPVIVFPEVSKDNSAFSIDRVGVAWDFSRAAARAVADALPVLQLARAVHVVTITKEKTINTRRSTADLAKYLAFHGIDVVFEEEEAAGRPVGHVLSDYVKARQLNLLVMGAYGHSRLRDFVLGGATKSIVAKPPVPVLLSH